MASRLPRIPPKRRLHSVVLFGCVVFLAETGTRRLLAQALPDAPSAVLGLLAPVSPTQAASTPQLPALRPIPPCDKVNQASAPGGPPPGQPTVAETRGQPCIQENPLQPIVSSKHLPPLTWQQKGELAARDITDPFNVITIVSYSGIVISSNPHTAYGPGLKGFGKLTGYSFLEDTQGEFFGTFAIPSLAHEDPRYYRMPGRPIPNRVLHALKHTIITRHDDGSHMLNYATLLTYPISAELSNLYVPGIPVSGPSTAKRIGLGLATDPAGALLAEFLPDLAKRIHIRVIFVQQTLQHVAEGGPSVQ